MAELSQEAYVDAHSQALFLLDDVVAELKPAHPFISNAAHKTLTEPALMIARGLVETARNDNNIPLGWFEYICDGQLNPGDPTEGLVGVYIKVWPMAEDLTVFKYRSFPMLKTFAAWPNYSLAEFGDIRPVNHFFGDGPGTELTLRTVMNGLLEIAYSRFRPNLPEKPKVRTEISVNTGQYL